MANTEMQKHTAEKNGADGHSKAAVDASERAKAVALGAKEGGMIGAAKRFKKIETDRFMYNANKLEEKKVKVDLVGYLINILPMAPIKGRAWSAFVVKTTEPTKGFDREGDLIDIPVGSEVLIPATHQLAQFFSIVAGHPTKVYEVMISPKKKINIGGGQTMWTFELGANPHNPLSRNDLGPAALLGYVDPNKVNALPAQGEISETVGEDGNDNTPF